MTRHERIEDVATIVRDYQYSMTSRQIAVRIDRYYRDLDHQMAVRKLLPKFVPAKLLAAVGVTG